jgi:hypothetical protein
MRMGLNLFFLWVVAFSAGVGSGLLLSAAIGAYK